MSIKIDYDWCQRHKINVINDPKYPVLGNSDLYEDPERQQWKWLRKVNDYAFARGVLPMGVFFGSNGYSKKLNKAMNICVIDHNVRYYCWSRDDLIKKRRWVPLSVFKKLSMGSRPPVGSGIFLEC